MNFGVEMGLGLREISQNIAMAGQQHLNAFNQ